MITITPGVSIGAGVSFTSGGAAPFPSYDFTSFTFTTGGTSGRTGPSLETLLSSYDTESNPWLVNTANFNMITNGYQLWTVPTTGTYRIVARGAQGAPAEAAAGGRGAIITGDFELTAGEKLQILVGQTAPINASRLYRSSPGGGGSFVVRYTGETNTVDDILVIAGGGGGSGSDPIPSEVDAQTGTSGGRGILNGGNNGGTGGADGSGGNMGATANGPGGGFLTNGSSSAGGAEGLSFLNGGLGGNTNISFAPSGGGFGGGGSPRNGDLNRFAGGGGYSGGGSSGFGSSAAQSNSGGGGGGSYNVGANQSALGGASGNFGAGTVYIERLT